MKRIWAGLLVAAGLLLGTAAPALAQGTYPPEPPAGTEITRDGLAFTGTEISVWMLVALALIVGGVVALVLGRRRSVPTE